MSILDNLSYRPGDKLMLKDWHEFDWYWDGDDTTEHAPVWIEPGMIFEVYAIGQLNLDEPYYTFELSHHIHGDITIDVAASEAEKIFVLNGRVTYTEHAYKRTTYVKPVEHHYGNSVEKPYIKYSCPVCDLLGNKHQVTMGASNCPLCNVNLTWAIEE